MTHKKGHLISNTTQQKVSRCPYCGATLRISDTGLTCPRGGIVHIFRAIKIDRKYTLPVDKKAKREEAANT